MRDDFWSRNRHVLNNLLKNRAILKSRQKTEFRHMDCYVDFRSAAFTTEKNLFPEIRNIPLHKRLSQQKGVKAA
jgi:hypothetical protein